jgi:predicted AlkP superfamily pyrophosphatase or phosphodiesterase
MTARWLLAPVLSSLLAITGQPAPTQAPARDRHVVLISIDGFADFMLDDPLLAVPAIRGLAARGVTAASLVPVNPTVTWPNHTTLVTGVPPAQHTVIYNGWAVRGDPGAPVRVEPRIEKARLVRGTTVYDAAHAAGLTTAEVDWVAIEKATTITWSFSEFAGPDGPVEREMVAAGLVTTGELAAFRKAPITWRDEIWTRAAEHIVGRHRPNLLLFHLLTTDSVQHTYGTRNLAARTALELADARVARLVEAYRQAGILDRTTFIVVADHGFKTARRTIKPNALFAREGLGQALWAISEGGTAMIYATGTSGQAEALARAKTRLQGIEGVTRVIGAGELAALGYPEPAPGSRMADLVVAAADGYRFDGTAEGEVVVDGGPSAAAGTHGYLNTESDMRAIFVASGAGIRPGVTIGDVRSEDVAPTIARLLGLSLPDATGRVIAEALR